MTTTVHVQTGERAATVTVVTKGDSVDHVVHPNGAGTFHVSDDVTISGIVEAPAPAEEAEAE